MIETLRQRTIHVGRFRGNLSELLSGERRREIEVLSDIFFENYSAAAIVDFRIGPDMHVEVRIHNG